MQHIVKQSPGERLIYFAGRFYIRRTDPDAYGSLPFEALVIYISRRMYISVSSSLQPTRADER